MYSINNYIHRGSLFIRNNYFPKHKKLATLMIYATDRCNSKCKHCLVWAKKPKQDLPFETIRNIVQNKTVNKNTVIGLEGGEFLLHPQSQEIMSLLDKQHPKYDLLSNCVLPERTIKAVYEHNPLRLFVSLDGNRETHNIMRGSDSYDSVIHVIEKCKDKIPVSVMFTLTPYNSFEDLIHVCQLCEKYNIDLRAGIYNNMPFFDTVDKAHDLKMENQEKNSIPDISSPDYKNIIPNDIKNFKENFDFLLLYDNWRKGNLKLNCNSILDSIIILPSGDVPICQNLSLKLGNVNSQALDEIINCPETIKQHKYHKTNCNKCWINFHRKYDIILYRSAEKAGGKLFAKALFGKYNWSGDKRDTYKKVLKEK